MKYILIIAAFVFINVPANAQHKIIFSSQNYAGLLEGENGSKFQLQTINGFKYKTWFAGIGTGIDWYYQRSIPLFASLNKGILKNGDRNFYLSADGGINFPWKNNTYYYGWGDENGKLSAGLYWSAGFGYRIGIGKHTDAILMHIGYSYKHLLEKTTTYVYPCLVYPCPEAPARYDLDLRRLSLKLGWNF
jgi:hypothetical protein